MSETTAAAEPNATLPVADVCIIGVDIGGTKIAAGCVEPARGTLTARREIPTAAHRGGEAVLDDVVRLCGELAQHTDLPLAAIGIGICELVDPLGHVQSNHTVAWQGLAVQSRLAQLAPAVVESDVRAHALAEACFGAGAPYTLFAFVTVGTGISSAIVLNRAPIAGAHGNALVLATSPLEVPDPAPPDATGRLHPPHSYVLEEYASGPALLARYQAATGRRLAHGRELFDLADSGDPIAHAVLESAGAALGNTLAFLINILDPEALVIGGGLGVAGGIYRQSLEAATRRAIYGDATRCLPILAAKLGPDAGIIGAALAAHTKLFGPMPMSSAPAENVP